MREHCGDCGLTETKLAEIPADSALLGDSRIVRLRPALRRVPQIRHLYKYVDVPLPPGKRFWFRDAQAGTGKEAASLYEFLHLIPSVSLASLEYHDGREDFSEWVETALGDVDLAARLRKLSHRELHGETLREALRQTVAARYEELNGLR